MKREMTNVLGQKILQNFKNALADVLDKVGDMLDEGTANNENDESQCSKTQLTLAPKILITYVTPGSFDIEVRVPAKRIEQVVGISADDFSVDPEGNPAEEAERLCSFGISKTAVIKALTETPRKRLNIRNCLNDTEDNADLIFVDSKLRLKCVISRGRLVSPYFML